MLVGFPDQRPGGLLLSGAFAVMAFGGAVIVGYGYAIVCGVLPRVSLALQGVLAALRGIPLLLLIFFVAQTTTLPLVGAGGLAILIYAVSHIGEVLRSYRTAYPSVLAEQSRVLGMSRVREEISLRAQWTFLRSMDALGTHAISLLKDTGALTIVGIAELTTIARSLGAGASLERWVVTVSTAAALYLAATLALIAGIRLLTTMVGQRGERLL